MAEGRTALGRTGKDRAKSRRAHQKEPAVPLYVHPSRCGERDCAALTKGETKRMTQAGSSRPTRQEEGAHPIQSGALIAGLMLAAAIGTQSATASTPAAWKTLQRQVERACIEGSGLRRPRVSSMTVFDDTLAMVALLVTGQPAKVRKNHASSTKLCLYNRRTRQVALEEAPGWGDRP